MIKKNETNPSVQFVNVENGTGREVALCSWPFSAEGARRWQDRQNRKVFKHGGMRKTLAQNERCEPEYRKNYTLVAFISFFPGTHHLAYLSMPSG